MDEKVRQLNNDLKALTEQQLRKCGERPKEIRKQERPKRWHEEVPTEYSQEK